MRGLMGTFAIMPLEHVIDFLARRKATGSLTCERGSVRKSIQLLEGDAIGASSTDPREYLGQLLLNFGHVTEEQLSKAFETQQATKVRLGKVLSMVGVVPAEVIRDTLALQTRETLLDAYLWDSGTFHVDDEAPPEAVQIEIRVPLQEIAREAEFRQTAWRAFRAQFPAGTAILRVDESRVPATLPAGSVDERLLGFAREGRTIDEIGLALHATDFHLYQRLYALNRQGIVTASSPPAGEVVPDGAVDAAPIEQLRAALLDPPRTLRLRISQRDITLMRLAAPEKYLLGRCDGHRTVRDIVQLAPLTEEDVLRALQRFVDTRLVEVAGISA